jgi:hypothetical protein
MPALAAGTIVVDGSFDDWTGRQNISDWSGDGKGGGDIRYFFWGTNADDSSMYFMLERYPDEDTGKGREVTYQVFVDTDNDGNFGGLVDRLVKVDYEPKQSGSEVEVEVRKANGDRIASYSGNWGQSRQDGALKAEVRVSFADLGIGARQTIRMYVVAEDKDRAPDEGDIQYSPIPILDYPLLTALVAGFTALLWWKRGRFAWR